ncbi:hypothetical protein LFT44_21115 (plasmid) [Arthrobacter sp. FW306-05-C]|uniref:hypothetical protein n=1 Tax=unclassified Arthrobacter TaxID=235627 RepID=UPI001EEF8176|nr:MULTISPECIES: hypothetical protein [unclassified Arthrobacter]UKA69026.1 hypothetical protein LFT44_21115 [Arthrobacter sp. FW306-05-C]UKA73336.1 hypothetical protein LFT49_21300 [Arthrobacter sp. FW306-06-A]
MTADQMLDQAHDPSHELADAVVQRVFYILNVGLYAPSPEFSSKDHAVAYARERSAAGDFGAISPAEVEVEVRAEYRLSSGRITQGIVEAFTVTA